jgi:hypothetical protein
VIAHYFTKPDLTAVGVLTLLIAFGIIFMMRVNAKRSKTKRPQTGRAYDARTDRDFYRITTHISARDSVNNSPFLTESEKAIVARAASHDSESHVNFPSLSDLFYMLILSTVR